MSLNDFNGNIHIPKLTEVRHKTRVCRSVYRNISCQYGNRCLFAHNKKELHIKECDYGEQCHNDNCVWFHPKSETKQEYLKRLDFPSKSVSFKTPLETQIPSKSEYNPPLHMPFLKIPVTFMNDKELCSLIIGRNGYHFKEITRLSGVNYIWLNSKTSQLEIWGHTHAIHIAYKMILTHIQSMAYHKQQFKQQLGEKLYPLVLNMTNETVAGKIVGMFLELNNTKINELFQPKNLILKVHEALDVLDENIDTN